ncbi:asialoglycoprotein receptor 1-like [Pseudonaja textilis]|uniref:asialoglycoprotein receptor 1-like n=1 Tax=Pseudonaja textilis TaxID=8673 RepID=UPI000EAA2CDB|nr:asialoglycoprotein receptor 1-like [Pseudonaja textilis]
MKKSPGATANSGAATSTADIKRLVPPAEASPTFGEAYSAEPLLGPNFARDSRLTTVGRCGLQVPRRKEKWERGTMATSVVNMDASEAPMPSETYENYQPANVEKEYETHFEKDFPLSKPLLQRFCSTSRLLLVLMVFSGALILSVSILGIQDFQFSKSLQGTQAGVENITQRIKQQLSSLKTKRNSTEGRLEELKKMLEKEVDRMLHVLHITQTQMVMLEKNSRSLHCEIIELKSNGSMSGCCPRGWLTFHTSCYWTTLSRGTWEEAKKDCEEKKAHLVILNSANEKAFVKTHRLGSNTWIGLTDSSGDWKWVDGSSYTVDPKDWGPGQPDHWYGHGLGGGEDCAHMREDALWNDNICSRTFTWVCEMELGI